MATPSKLCGDLRERVTVLKLEKTADSYNWTAVRRVWANMQPAGKNVFSSAGVGAKGVQLVLRRQPLSLTNMILWRGKYVFLSDIQPYAPGHLLVSGALVEISDCVADVHNNPPGPHFPAILTEKYLKHDQLEPYAINILTYVLVTPKCIVLDRGGLVKVGETNYEVQLAHVLDPNKNEYEIVRTEDL